MKKLSQYWAIILLIVIVGGGLFYWHEWRPSQIKKGCYESTKIIADDYDFNDPYNNCLRSKGY